MVPSIPGKTTPLEKDPSVKAFASVLATIDRLRRRGRGGSPLALGRTEQSLQGAGRCVTFVVNPRSCVTILCNAWRGEDSAFSVAARSHGRTGSHSKVTTYASMSEMLSNCWTSLS